MKLLSVLTLLVATAGIQQTMGHPAAGTAGTGTGTGKPPAKPNPPPANPTYPTTYNNTNTPTTTTNKPAAPSQTVTINGKQLIYPALDITPNTNDPVVKQWLSTLDLSNVPNLGPSNGGKVNYNPTLCGPPTVIAPNQGSWTCQRFVAPDDIADCPDKFTWNLNLLPHYWRHWQPTMSMQHSLSLVLAWCLIPIFLKTLSVKVRMITVENVP